MSGYYENLTFDEQGKVLAAMAGLKLNAQKGIPITRQDVNVAFLQATGKPLSIGYMRDPAVVQLMSLAGPGSGLKAIQNKPRTFGAIPSSTAITDRNLATRGLPVPKTSAVPPAGTTRYSAASVGGSRFSR